MRQVKRAALTLARVALGYWLGVLMVSALWEVAATILGRGGAPGQAYVFNPVVVALSAPLFLLCAGLAEAQSIRSLHYYLAWAAGLPVFLAIVFTPHPAAIVLVAAAAMIGGAVYWAIAGRFAGNRPCSTVSPPKGQRDPRAAETPGHRPS